APYFDIEEEFEIQQTIIELIKNKLILSAHDISEGGLFITLIESAFNRELGFKVNAADTAIRKDAYWFGEAQSRIVVSIKNDTTSKFEFFLREKNIAFEKLGLVTNNEIIIDGNSW